ENASKAFLYALKIANIYEATLYVLHSFQPPVLSFSHAGQPSALDDVYTEISLSKFDFYKKRVPELHQMADEQGLRYDNVIFVFEEGQVNVPFRKASIAKTSNSWLWAHRVQAD